MAAKLAIVALLLTLACNKLFASRSSTPCDWINGIGKLVPLIAGDIWSLTSSTVGECRAHCTNQTSFICAAVNYRQSDSECELLTESDQTGTVETTLTEWEYFIRPLCEGIWFPWLAVRGQKINDIANIIDQTTVANLSDCMSGCLHRVSPSSFCNSISVSRNGNTCDQYNDTIREGGVTSVDSEVWQSFNTPLWYRGSSPGVSTGHELRKRAVFGPALRIFNDVKITINGYLIGWQYYLIDASLHDLCNTSYVSIWGVRNQSNTYDHITSTLLRPENPGVESIRFQFVQDELIHVRANDLIGMYGYGCTNPVRHAVSGWAEPNPPTNTERRTTFSLDSFINPQFDNDFTDGRFAISLRAYVAGYTKLPSPPSSSHTSVSHGQIRLVIPALTSSDSLGAVYYRIICSTDSSFSQSYNCHDEIVPAGTTEVILDGLGITTPLYASVRMVRNFKGQESVEDEKQTTSLFCPERNKLIETDININITEHLDNTASVELIPISNNQDSCVQLVSINYNGTEVFTGDSLQPSLLFTVTQSPSHIYSFTMSLTLIDGHEMMYWEGEADLTPPPTSTRSPNVGTTLQNTGTSTKQNNVAKIVVPVVLVLLLLVLGGVLAVVLIRRRNTKRREASASKSTQMPNDSGNTNYQEENNHSYETLAGEGMIDHTYERPEVSHSNNQNLPAHYENVAVSNDDQEYEAII